MERLLKIDLHVKYLNRLIIFILAIITLSSCKSDRFSHEDKDYLYYWRYKISGDSILYKYNKPRTVEYKIEGGRHRSRKNKTHRIYVRKSDGSREIVRLPYSDYPNRCDIVDKAQEYDRQGKTLIGIFRESFYPYYDLDFIKYK